jgi:hypothetical protein
MSAKYSKRLIEKSSQAKTCWHVAVAAVQCGCTPDAEEEQQQQEEEQEQHA